MTENQLTPKELYDQRRAAEKGRSAGAERPASGSGAGKKIGLWVLVALLLGGAVWGIYKLATSVPPGGGNGAGALLADPVTPTDWTTGAKNPKVRLVEYADLQCPACAFYAPWVAQLVKDLPDDLAVTYRYFPLRTIHQNAQVSAQVAEAAGLQGFFWLAIETIFAHQHDWEEQLLPRDTLYKLMVPLGVNLDKLKQDVDSEVAKNKIEADFQSGLRSGVDSTPSFFLNGKKIENPKTYDDFKKLILDARPA